MQIGIRIGIPSSTPPQGGATPGQLVNNSAQPLVNNTPAPLIQG